MKFFSLLCMPFFFFSFLFLNHTYRRNKLIQRGGKITLCLVTLCSTAYVQSSSLCLYIYSGNNITCLLTSDFSITLNIEHVPTTQIVGPIIPITYENGKSHIILFFSKKHFKNPLFFLFLIFFYLLVFFVVFYISSE